MDTNTNTLQEINKIDIILHMIEQYHSGDSSQPSRVASSLPRGGGAAATATAAAACARECGEESRCRRTAAETADRWSPPPCRLARYRSSLLLVRCSRSESGPDCPRYAAR